MIVRDMPTPRGWTPFFGRGLPLSDPCGQSILGYPIQNSTFIIFHSNSPVQQKGWLLRILMWETSVYSIKGERGARNRGRIS